MVLTLLACPTPDLGPTDTATGRWAAGYASVALPTFDPSDTGDPTDTEDTGDSPVLDADGDGHLAESDGGDDCDDTNPRVYPGAEDWCTAIDEDCDGIAIDDGRCADTQAFLSRATKFAEEGYFGMLPVRDLTGDGLDDLLLFDGYGSAGLAYGDGTWEGFADWPATVGFGPEDDCTWWDEVHLDVGDIDGDGYNDVALSAYGCGSGYDIAWGPIGESGAELTRWEGPPAFRTVEQRWVDADGDGASDLLYWTVDEAADEDLVVLYFGGQRTADLTVITSERTGNAGQDRLGDVDGDGCDDFEIAYGIDIDSPTWFSGANLTRGVDVLRDDVMSGTITSAEGVEMNGSAYPEWVAVGDWSGDGLDDAIFIDTMSHRGSLYFYDDFTSSADVIPGGRVDNDVVEAPIGVYTSPLRQDGVPKMLLLSNNTLEPEQYIVLPDDWIAGTNNLSEIRHLVVDNVTGDWQDAYCANAWGLGDIDNDGWSDAAITSNVGAFYFAPFTDIPWSEDRYW